MPAELMLGQKPIMPTEGTITTWDTLPQVEEINREDLLALWIQQLARREEDVKRVVDIQEVASWKNKAYFDKTHRLQPKKIEEGDWVHVYDSSLINHQHSSLRK